MRTQRADKLGGRGRYLLAILFWGSGCMSGGAEEEGNALDSEEGASSTYCGEVDAWPAGALAQEEEVLERINGHRATGGRCGVDDFPSSAPLEFVAALQCAARVHSQDMIARDFFDHDSPEGLSPFDRMERAGYSFRAAAENIAEGYPTAQAVVAGWMTSPGHCRNILESDFTHTGIARAEEDGRIVWTQTFGRPR